jgi:hypothetical protein
VGQEEPTKLPRRRGARRSLILQAELAGRRRSATVGTAATVSAPAPSCSGRQLGENRRPGVVPRAPGLSHSGNEAARTAPCTVMRRALVALNGMMDNSRHRGPQATFLCAEARAPRLPYTGARAEPHRRGRRGLLGRLPELPAGDPDRLREGVGRKHLRRPNRRKMKASGNWRAGSGAPTWRKRPRHTLLATADVSARSGTRQPALHLTSERAATRSLRRAVGMKAPHPRRTARRHARSSRPPIVAGLAPAPRSGRWDGLLGALRAKPL